MKRILFRHVTVSRLAKQIKASESDQAAEALLRFAIHRGKWRLVDFGMGILAITWGLYVIAPFDAFGTAKAYASLREHVGEFMLGAALISSGVIRLAALAINGFWRASPGMRAGAAVIGVMCWSQILIGFGVSTGWRSTAIPIYSAMMFADFAAMFAAVQQQRWASDA